MSPIVRQTDREESECCEAPLEYLEQTKNPSGEWRSVYECSACGNEVRVP